MNEDTEYRLTGMPPIKPNSHGNAQAPALPSSYPQDLTLPKNLEGKPLREYVALYLQYWTLVLGCVILCFTIAAVSTHRAPRIYQTSALVNVGSYVPPLDGPMAGVLRTETTRGDYVDSQVELLKSYSIARIALSHNPQIASYVGLDPSLITQAQETQAAIKEAESRAEDIQLPELPIDDTIGVSIPVYALEAYLGLISYNQVASTSLVKITARAKSPEIAALIANAHANAFVTIVVHQRLLSATVNMQFLRERARQASKKAKETESKMIEAAKAAGVDVRNDKDVTSIFGNRYLTLVSSLNEVSQQRAGYQGTLRQLRNSSSNQGTIRTDNQSRDLFIKLQEIEGDYETVRKVRPNSPALKSLKAQITVYKNIIKAAGQQDIKDIEIKYRSAVEQEKLLREQLKELQREETKATEDRIQFTYLERETKAAKDIFDQISKRLEDAIVNAQNDQKTVVVVDPAIPLSTPISPNVKNNLITGILLGLLLGCAIVYWIDFSDNSIRSTSDIKRALNTQILGVVPSFQNMEVLHQSDQQSEAGKDSPTSTINIKNINSRSFQSADGSGLGSILSDSSTYPDNGMPYTPPTEVKRFSEVPPVSGSGTRKIPRLNSSARWNSVGVQNRRKRTKNDSTLVMINSPLSAQSEAFRNIRTTLKLASATPPQLLLITSAQKGDGKSTIAANLAIAFAQLGARTLLLDADLRLGSVHKLFGVSSDAAGLSDYLLGESDFADAILQTSVPNLQILTAGPPDPCPGELLGSRRMVELLEILAADYDQIIIDTPPATVVSDGLLLARLVDGSILVVRSGKTPKTLAQYGLNRLRQVHSEVLGVILNDVTAARTYGEPEYLSLETNNDYFKKALILQKPKSK